MSIDSTCSAKKLNLERATNFMRQFRDPDSRELKKLSANQFMEVWSHYDRDGNGYIEGTELDGFLKEFVSSANFTDISPDMKSVLALAVLVVFAAVTDSSVIPYDNSDTSDVAFPLSVGYSDVADATSGDYLVIPSSSSAELTPDDNELLSPMNEDFAVAPFNSRRPSLAIGTIGNSRRLILIHVNRAGISNTVLTQNVEYRRAGNARITAVRAFPRVQNNQGASVALTGGGVGSTFVRLRITSRRGGPIYYAVEVYGR